MRLVDLELESAPDKNRKVGRIPFRWRVHHVKEVFLHLIPRDFELDGSGKIQLSFGACNEEPRYSALLGTTNYYVDDFDFEQLASSGQAEGDQYVLHAIERALTDVARTHSRDSEAKVGIIKATAQAVRDNQFALEIPVKKLAKSSVDRKHKMTIFRLLSPEDGEIWVARFRDSGREEVQEALMTERPHYLNLTQYFCKSSWVTDHFEVSNQLGQAVYRSPTVLRPLSG